MPIGCLKHFALNTSKVNLLLLPSYSFLYLIPQFSLHRNELEAISQRHAQTLGRLRQAEQSEARTIAEVEPTGTRLQELLGSLLGATTELQKSESERRVAADTRLTALERREDGLRQAEEHIRLRVSVTPIHSSCSLLLIEAYNCSTPCV